MDYSSSTASAEMTSYGMEPNQTVVSNGNNTECAYYKDFLTFDNVQALRVIIMCLLFAVSACGNCFVLYCLWIKERRSHVHIISLHLTLADLAFTFFAIPMDAVWNVTMAWLGGEGLCKIAQMLKQFGMYISSFMVVVIGLDRVCSILSPMSTIPDHKKRTKIFLGVAWVVSVLCSIPPAVLFSLGSKVFCDDEPPFTQCLDFKVVPRHLLHPYYFFTMIMSFILPFIIAMVSYSLVLYEITNMQKRDRNIRGRKDSTNSSSIAKARKKTMILTSMVTATFVLLWGPYYGFAIYTWFDEEKAKQFPREISLWLLLLMYVHPTVHPFIYGVFMKDVRKRFLRLTTQISQCFSFQRISETKAPPIPSVNGKQAKKSGFSNCCPCNKMDFFSFREMHQSLESKSNSTPYSSTRTSRVVIPDDHLQHSESLTDRHKNLFLFKEDRFLNLPKKEEMQKFLDVKQKS